jgi:flagellar protein FliT
MKPINKCFVLTKNLLDISLQDYSEREEFIDQVEALLNEREEVLKEIQPPFSLEEIKIGLQIVQWNKVIDSFLIKAKSSIMDDIQEVKIKKNTVQKYVNPYQALQGDGVYYDKKN